MEKDVGLKLSEDVMVEDLGDRLYKFLGAEEAEQHENKVVLRKLRRLRSKRHCGWLQATTRDYRQ